MLERTHAEATQQAMDLAHKKPFVLVNERALLLADTIGSRLEKHFKDPENQGSAGALVLAVRDAIKYLKMGYLYFRDLGISADTEFHFVELGRESRTFAAELEAAPTFYQEAFGNAQSRREKYQRMILDCFLAEDAQDRAAEDKRRTDELPIELQGG